MPTLDLDKDAPVPGAKYYLDTSALIALVAIQAKKAKEPFSQLDETRGTRVIAFAKKVISMGGAIRTTILSMEEVAAKARNATRREFFSKPGYSSWDAFKKQAPKDAEAADVLAHKRMLQMMEWAADGLGNAGGRFESPSVNGDAIASATNLRKAHRNLLIDNPALDAMDALHIVLGIEIEANAFVSFDKAWHGVKHIVVYH